MEVFTVAFFGHRYVDNFFTVENKLEEVIRDLLCSKQYVEFLVGRNGDFDQMVSSTVLRMKRNVRDDNSALRLVLNLKTTRTASTTTTMKLKFAMSQQKHTSRVLCKSEIEAWLTVQI